jgi:hypothetical protein
VVFHSGTVSDTVVTLVDLGFTLKELQTYDAVHLTGVGGALRYRYEGGDPASDEGHLMENRASIVLYGTENLQNLAMIRETNDVVVSATVGDYE